MNTLLETLMNCPNLSLRILDNSTGRTVKTIDNKQLSQFINAENAACYKDCGETACPNKPK